ncbi:MAG: hypothetical protein AAFP78_04345 [Pseudomonadota bacterium]
MIEHQLTFPIDGVAIVGLGPLTGAAERAAAGDAHRLVAALTEKLALDRLTIGDRDRLLAALYGSVYGPDVLADARCGECGAKIELRFSLEALVAGRRPDGSAKGSPPQVSVGDASLRLPTVGDAARLGDADPAAFVEALTTEGDAPERALAEAALEAADPALELDLAATCPECGAAQSTPFSMSGFFSAALSRDLQFLMRETHLIAKTYGWSLDAIMSLTRVERQEFVRLILADLGVGARSLRTAS